MPYHVVNFASSGIAISTVTIAQESEKKVFVTAGNRHWKGACRSGRYAIFSLNYKIVSILQISIL